MRLCSDPGFATTWTRFSDGHGLLDTIQPAEAGNLYKALASVVRVTLSSQKGSSLIDFP